MKFNETLTRSLIGCALSMGLVAQVNAATLKSFSSKPIKVTIEKGSCNPKLYKSKIKVDPANYEHTGQPIPKEEDPCMKAIGTSTLKQDEQITDLYPGQRIKAQKTEGNKKEVICEVKAWDQDIGLYTKKPIKDAAKNSTNIIKKGAAKVATAVGISGDDGLECSDPSKEQQN